MIQQADPNSGSLRTNRRFKHMLLDHRFQLKYTGMIVGVATVLSVFLGGFLFSKVNENSRILGLDDLEGLAFDAQLAHADNELFFIIGGSILAFLIVVSLLSILITHRMAGPIFVMKRHLTTLASGSLPNVRALRKGDEFTEFYAVLTDAVTAIETQVLADVDIVSRTIAALENQKDPQISRIREELERLLTAKKQMAESAGSAPSPTDSPNKS